MYRNCSAKRLCSLKYDFRRNLRGKGSKKFSVLAIAGHILWPLINFDIIQPQSQPPLGWGWESPHHSQPLLTPLASQSWRLWHLKLDAPTFQTKVTPLHPPHPQHLWSKASRPLTSAALVWHMFMRYHILYLPLTRASTNGMSHSCSAFTTIAAC